MYQQYHTNEKITQVRNDFFLFEDSLFRAFRIFND
jgi:hypothetical protein